MNLSIAEENYLKTMYKIVLDNNKEDISSSEISSALQIKPASVSNMLTRFRNKGLVNFTRYSKASLTSLGKEYGQKILRKHRIWETFLCVKLGFDWNEVHDVAEQLEHIKSEKLLDKIDEMLGFPKFDPHGECIPQQDGSIPIDNRILLSQAEPESNYIVVGLKDSTIEMLDYLKKTGIEIKTKIKFISILKFDNSLELKVNDKTVIISTKVADNIYIDNI